MFFRNGKIFVITVIGAVLWITSVAAVAEDLPEYSWAWSENAGWLNLDPTHGTITVTQEGLSGYAWAENVGWISFGADAGPPYANTNPDNWGVNLDESDTLQGYAWGEAIGWINFNPTHGGVTYDPLTQSLNGFAWAENIGWINFSSFVVIFSDSFESP